ncbi:hypothetical protein PMAYCL1PPCAC_27817, partial [Pristionchus mayeri]
SPGPSRPFNDAHLVTSGGKESNMVSVGSLTPTTMPMHYPSPRPSRPSYQQNIASFEWRESNMDPADRLNPATIPAYTGFRSNPPIKRAKVEKSENSFPCSECGKNLSRKDALDCHMRIHTGVKPFPCTLCGKSFRVRSFLISHIKTAHGTQPYACLTCGEQFTYQQDVGRHLVWNPWHKMQSLLME